jgi:hypothetical protein
MNSVYRAENRLELVMIPLQNVLYQISPDVRPVKMQLIVVRD